MIFAVQREEDDDPKNPVEGPLPKYDPFNYDEYRVWVGEDGGRKIDYPIKEGPFTVPAGDTVPGQWTDCYYTRSAEFHTHGNEDEYDSGELVCGLFQGWCIPDAAGRQGRPLKTTGVWVPQAICTLYGTFEPCWQDPKKTYPPDWVPDPKHCK